MLNLFTHPTSKNLNGLIQGYFNQFPVEVQTKLEKLNPLINWINDFRVKFNDSSEEFDSQFDFEQVITRLS